MNAFSFYSSLNPTRSISPSPSSTGPEAYLYRLSSSTGIDDPVFCAIKLSMNHCFDLPHSLYVFMSYSGSSSGNSSRA